MVWISACRPMACCVKRPAASARRAFADRGHQPLEQLGPAPCVRQGCAAQGALHFPLAGGRLAEPAGLCAGETSLRVLSSAACFPKAWQGRLAGWERKAGPGNWPVAASMLGGPQDGGRLAAGQPGPTRAHGQAGALADGQGQPASTANHFLALNEVRCDRLRCCRSDYGQAKHPFLDSVMSR
jgi:hypothetical protein